jgi:hypothetical protein
MVDVSIKPGTEFPASLNRFMEAARKFAKFTAEFTEKIKKASAPPSSSPPPPPNWTGPSDTVRFFRQFNQLMRKFETGIASTLERAIQAVGPRARTFIRSIPVELPGLNSIVESFLKRIPVTATTGSLALRAVGALSGPAGWAAIVGFEIIKTIWRFITTTSEKMQQDYLLSLQTKVSIVGNQKLHGVGKRISE